jgi:exopolysaccharide production protein ExoQ
MTISLSTKLQQGREQMVKLSSPSTAEKVFTVFVLLLSTGAFLNLAVKPNEDLASGIPAMQWLWTALYLITLVLVARRCEGLGALLKREWTLCLLLVFVLVSAGWSDDPILSIRHGVALVLSSFFGLYFACRYSMTRQLRLLAIVFAIVAVMSVFFELLGLGRAVDAGEGVHGWIGVFVQKNQLGLMMTFAAAVFLRIRKSDPEYRSWAGPGFIFALILLLLSRSAAALVILILLLIISAVLGWFRRSWRKAIAGLILLFGLIGYCAIWTVQNLVTVTEFLGKDPSLSGRVPLWILSITMALRRPWLGYGYDAFWRGKEGASSAIWRVLRWDPPHSHNGFLEVWIGLGIVGMLIFLSGFAVYLLRAIVLLRAGSEGEVRWPLIFLALLVLANLTGANLISRNSMYWILYVSVGMSSARVAQYTVRRHDG